MNRKEFLSVLFLLGILSHLNAQNNFWDSRDAYLGQKTPGNNPEKFAPALINDTPFFPWTEALFRPTGKHFIM